MGFGTFRDGDLGGNYVGLMVVIPCNGFLGMVS